MKILVIGLDGASPETLLDDEGLETIQSLRDVGCYGRLECTSPPDSSPLWTCLPSSIADSNALQARTIWDQTAEAGGESILVGLPAKTPLGPVKGVSVGDFLDLAAAGKPSAHPAEVAATIEKLAGAESLASADDRSNDADPLEASRKQFAVVRHLAANAPWDYFQLVDSGMARIGRDAGGPSAEVARNYLLHLDREIANALEVLTEDALVLIASVDPAGQGAFILAGSQLPPLGAIEGVRLIDVAPTLLELTGRPPLPDAQGRNFLAGREVEGADPSDLDDELVRERLRGLGYIG